MNNEQNPDKHEKKGKKIILPKSVEEKMKAEEKAKEADKKDAKIVEDLAQKLEKSEEEIKRLHKEYMLLQAEFSNFQKRQRKLEEERAKYALQPFVSSMLSHIDSFEHALATDSKADAKSILEGFMLIYNGLNKVFTDFDVKTITPEKGDPINLEYHEVMLTAEDPELSNNTVFNMIQKGYMLSDRVIRPAKVVAVKNPQPKVEEPVTDVKPEELPEIIDLKPEDFIDDEPQSNDE